MAALGYPVFAQGRFIQILTGPWSPLHHHFGISPMLIGTGCVATLALLIAVPISIGCAVFIHTTAPKGIWRVVHNLVQLMTGIPTVVYGFAGIFLLVPLVREIFGRGSGLCILTAAIMLSVLVSPTIILFFVDGLKAVPAAYCKAVSALGATPIQRLLYVEIPLAWPSLLAGVVLGFGRAVGDTMIALMLAGNAVASPESVLDPVRTLTAHIALIIAADFDSLEFRSLFVCGLTLYAITTMAIIIMRCLTRRRMLRP
jgi:phosphate transport system permease protein